MINKTRLKFVGITMVILFLVFWIIGLISHTVLTTHNKHQTNVILGDFIHQTVDEDNPQVFVKGIVAVEDMHGNVTLFFDENTYTEEQSVQYYNNALNYGIESGNFNKVFYKLIDNQTYKVFVAIDRTNEISLLNKAFLSIVTALIVVYLTLFIVVYLLSYWVVAPLKTALENQMQFISDAGHELKTPISIISASNEVLSATNKNEYTQNIKEQTNRLSYLINDLLSIAKLEEQKKIKSKKQINLSNLVNSVILPFDAVAFEKNKILETDITPNINIIADEQAIKKVLQIMIDNALKYSKENTAIICFLGKMNNKTTLGVYNQTDTAKSGNENKLFERFYRDDKSRSRQTGGSGLGLAIAKQTCELNKWRISVQVEDEKSFAIWVQFD